MFAKGLLCYSHGENRGSSPLGSANEINRFQIFAYGPSDRWTAGWTGNQRKKLVIATTCREEILACQLAGSISLHTGEVVGSIPTAPTIISVG